MGGLMQPLLPPDDAVPAERLTELERVIERGLETFVEVGQALLEINQQRLYRHLGYSAFADYCQERWGWTSKRAYRLIEAAKVVELLEDPQVLPIGNTPESVNNCSQSGEGEVSPIGDTSESERPRLPANEAQTRELARLKDPVSIRDTWRAVLDAHPDRVTAADVRDAVDERLDRRQARAAAREEQRQNIATSEALLAIAGDSTGEIARGKIARECMDAVVEFRRLMRQIDPERHVPVMEEDERMSIRELLRDVRAWADGVERELRQSLWLVVSRSDDDDV